jgi:DME family drug/metabolite transporter
MLILSFVFGQVIGDTAYFSAQKELGVTISLAISMTFPLFTFIFSLIFLNRRFELNLFISLTLIAIGIVIIGRSKINSENSKHEKENVSTDSTKIKLGNIFQKKVVMSIGYCFTASLGWAIGAVIIEFATDKIDLIIQSEELTSVIGNVIRFPFAFLILGSMVWRENIMGKNNNRVFYNKKTKRTWILLIVASILGTSIGAFLYTEGIHIAGANIMALIASTSPLFALPLTYFINKEKISKFGFIGVIFTISGVVIILI